MSFDVTEDLARRKELTATASKLREILESSPVGVSISNRSDGAVKFSNTRQLEIIGATSDQAFGKPTARYWVNKSDRESLLEDLAQHGQASGVFEMRKYDGTPIWCLHSWRMMLDTPDDVLVWIYDVTDIKNAEAAITAAKEEAERANLAKSNFLSSMSHELRTPLNAVLGFSQLLELDTDHPLSEDQLIGVEQIRKSGSHLLSLINNVLDLNSIEEGKMSLNISNVDLVDLIKDCVKLSEPLSKDVTVTFSTTNSTDVKIHADPLRLKQVLLNLIGNAVKYNKKVNGRVSLRFDASEDKEVTIFVADTGIGIPHGMHHLVFTPFERLGREAASVEGSGVGLAIAKQIIEAMGGRIGFTSEPDVGSEFWIKVLTADC